MAKLSKKQVKELGEKLKHQSPTVWEKATSAEREAIFALAERYKDYLDRGKTERRAVAVTRELAEEKGFQPLSARGKGGKYYTVFQDKVVALAVMGKRPLAQGLRILGAHLDAPRLDLKSHPLYENTELAFLKTHYYGGLRKYQWMARPMAIYGVVSLKDGRNVELAIGDALGDPVFCVLDLLPHLARKVQSEKKLMDAFEAERMNLVVAGLPLDGGEGEGMVKLAALKLLNERYGITESDFISAELEIVPAGQAQDVGLDRSLVGAYGQDDRGCAFASLWAAAEAKKSDMPSLVLLVDKEEIGSDGATGAQSRYLELLLAELMEKAGEPTGLLPVARALAASQAISSDVTGAFDPDYPEVHEKRNAAYMGHGVALHKYTGHGGKYGASDASAEYMAWMRRIWDAAGVVWQAAGGMGKVDEGGGGTIAKFLARHGMEVVDSGLPVLSMHSPFEITHKADLYSMCLAYKAFLEAPGR